MLELVLEFERAFGVSITDEAMGAKVFHSVETIAAFLGDLSLVALAFPAFNDGRSFSKAELLRSRHGFEGAVRFA